MDLTRIYDIIYSLAARDGREHALFGDYAPVTREAFSRSLVCDAFPELWFELPLTGKPWLDFHALTSYEDVTGTRAAFAGHGGVYNDALTWFAAQKPHSVRQLALSYDTSRGKIDQPAVQLLVDRRNDEVPVGFLRSVGRPDTEGSYRMFVRNMPQKWYPCYVGIFPGRATDNESPWLRLECIVGDECQRGYANDTALLRKHLTQVGLKDMGSDAVAYIQELARSPFPLEFQFNVGPDGLALPVISASVRFQPEDWIDLTRQRAISALVAWIQAQNLADNRCALLAQTLFAKRATQGNETMTISCCPIFVKLRFRKGQAPDAKAYLMAQAF